MRRCPEPHCNGLLFIEDTEDGLETFCLAGHRFSAVPLVVTDPRHLCSECLTPIEVNERYRLCSTCRTKTWGKQRVT